MLACGDDGVMEEKISRTVGDKNFLSVGNTSLRTLKPVSDSPDYLVTVCCLKYLLFKIKSTARVFTIRFNRFHSLINPILLKLRDENFVHPHQRAACVLV